MSQQNPPGAGASSPGTWPAGRPADESPEQRETFAERPSRLDAAEARAAELRVQSGLEKSKARTAARVPRLLASRAMAAQAAAKAQKK